jgi:hypothetical protein
MDNQNHENLIEWRVTKLEDAVISLNSLAATVNRWDSRLAESAVLLQFPLYVERFKTHEERLTAVELIAQDLTKWKWKLVGIFSAVIFIIQIFGTPLADGIKSSLKADKEIQIVHTNQVPWGY